MLGSVTEGLRVEDLRGLGLRGLEFRVDLLKGAFFSKGLYIGISCAEPVASICRKPPASYQSDGFS